MLVPDRRREDADVDVGAGYAVGEEGRVGDLARHVALKAAAADHPGLQRFERREVRVEPEGERRTLGARRRIAEHAKPRPVAGDVVEEQRRRVGHAGRDFRHGADVVAHVGAAQAAQAAEVVDAGDEVAEVGVGERGHGAFQSNGLSAASLAAASLAIVRSNNCASVTFFWTRPKRLAAQKSCIAMIDWTFGMPDGSM